MQCLRRCFGKLPLCPTTESLNLHSVPFALPVVWCYSTIDRKEEYNDKKFVDRLVVTARAGHGGQGCASYVKRRSKSEGCSFCERNGIKTLALIDSAYVFRLQYT